MERSWADMVATARRRAARSKVLRSLVTAVAVVAVAAGVTAAYRGREFASDTLRHHPYFHVARIEIRGVASLVDEEEVRRWTGIDVGDSLWDARPETIKARLESHPMLRSASVRRVFPNALEIRVRERRPAAITVIDDLYYIDRTGERFGPLDADHDRDYPIFTGVTKDADGRRRWALRRALHMLRRGDGAGLEISEIHLDPVEGLILYPSTPRVPLFLGWQGWERRLQKAVRALRSWEGAAERLARVDLRFRDQVVVQFREAKPVPVGSDRLPKVST